jgi:hypothetical protein
MSFSAEPASPGLVRDSGLPGPALAAALRATDDGQAFMLSVVDESQAVRSALLGAAEIFFREPDELRLALWAGSRTAAHLQRTRRATLALVCDGHFAQIGIAVATVVELAGFAGLQAFTCRIVRTEAQRVGYALLDSGLVFSLPEGQRASARKRWRAQRAALAALA